MSGEPDSGGEVLCITQGESVLTFSGLWGTYPTNRWIWGKDLTPDDV
jgi:hypothetical protein